MAVSSSMRSGFSPRSWRNRLAKRAASGHPPRHAIPCSPGGSPSGLCPSGAFLLPLAFASQAATFLPVPCSRNLADKRIALIVRPQTCMRRSSMSLGRPNQLSTQAKQDQAKKQSHCGTQDQLDKLRSRTVRLTVNLPADLADHMRDAVYWTPGLTLAWSIASAIRTSLTELETSNRAPFSQSAQDSSGLVALE
jgi:hypothetical protein